MEHTSAHGPAAVRRVVAHNVKLAACTTSTSGKNKKRPKTHTNNTRGNPLLHGQSLARRQPRIGIANQEAATGFKVRSRLNKKTSYGASQNIHAKWDTANNKQNGARINRTPNQSSTKRQRIRSTKLQRTRTPVDCGIVGHQEAPEHAGHAAAHDAIAHADQLRAATCGP